VLPRSLEKKQYLEMHHDDRNSEKENGLIYIHLYHGRKTPHEELDDWGVDGPVLGPFDWFHGTYFTTFKLGTLLDDDAWWLGDNPGFEHDPIYYDGMYYGDFEIIASGEKQKNNTVPFEKSKEILADYTKPEKNDWQDNEQTHQGKRGMRLVTLKAV